MKQYWIELDKKDFGNAYSMLEDMIYLAKGMSYDKESSNGISEEMFINMLDLKIEIDGNIKNGKIVRMLRFYIEKIYKVIDIKYS